MKKIILAVLIGWIVFACQTKQENTHQHSEAQETAPVDTIKKSIPKEAHAVIGGAHFTMKYHAPAVRGRTIWGGLVPYNEVWVTGAHRATSIEIDKDILLNGNKVSAGKYAFFTIPGEQSWTVIINKKWDQHLADEYSATEDVIRFEVKPEKVSQVQERLLYAFKSDGGQSGILTFAWEQLRLTIRIEVM